MSWIGLTDLKRAHFNPAGIGTPKSEAVKEELPNAILAEGTLIVETRFLATEDTPQEVLRFARHREWKRELSLTLHASGKFEVEAVQGRSRIDASLDFPVPHQDTGVRLYYSWNGPQRWARLAIKFIASGEFHVAYFDDPLPMPVLDAMTIMRNGNKSKTSEDCVFLAVSDKVEPIGLGAGICEGTPVETPSGAVPIERLRLGDSVVTASSGVQPVRWITKRTVPALGAFRPVRLRAPFFGLENDLTMAPDHRIRVGGAEAEYMLGEDDVLLETRRLVGSHAACPDERAKLVTYYQVLLDQHDCLLHDTVWSESLFVGQIALDKTRLSATALAHLPVTALPMHRVFARHRLSDHEARSLAMVLHR
ncbi:Hint domain-containing protein [Maritimibacter sp. DP1N21-5]|uniref:Hint domain-containing protein n=1 Tax=Maritimibacter sp. DP1N21-5 TaxID=2836867 RepID=UPI001C451012|nr:Hint domain-containing protein [Maritimibacter sp. DP1N21-5]MBV7407759.1 Hint domain-containing protein [Maritimibacter sp. DP1N21-5]